MNRGSLFLRVEGGLRLKGEYSAFLNMLFICSHQNVWFYASSLSPRRVLWLCMLVGVGTWVPRKKEAETYTRFLGRPCFPPPTHNEAEEPFLSESRLEVFRPTLHFSK